MRRWTLNRPVPSVRMVQTRSFSLPGSFVAEHEQVGICGRELEMIVPIVAGIEGFYFAGARVHRHECHRQVLCPAGVKIDASPRGAVTGCVAAPPRPSRYVMAPASSVSSQLTVPT